MEKEIRVGDVGTLFKITIKDDSGNPVDISSATTHQLIFKSENGTSSVKNCTFVTDGTDGMIQYTTVSGDIDKEGKWLMQASIETPSGNWRTNAEKFFVTSKL